MTFNYSIQKTRKAINSKYIFAFLVLICALLSSIILPTMLESNAGGGDGGFGGGDIPSNPPPDNTITIGVTRTIDYSLESIAGSFNICFKQTTSISVLNKLSYTIDNSIPRSENTLDSVSMEIEIYDGMNTISVIPLSQFPLSHELFLPTSFVNYTNTPIRITITEVYERDSDGNVFLCYLTGLFDFIFCNVVEISSYPFKTVSNEPISNKPFSNPIFTIEDFFNKHGDKTYSELCENITFSRMQVRTSESYFIPFENPSDWQLIPSGSFFVPTSLNYQGSVEPMYARAKELNHTLYLNYCYGNQEDLSNFIYKAPLYNSDTGELTNIKICYTSNPLMVKYYKGSGNYLFSVRMPLDYDVDFDLINFDFYFINNTTGEIKGVNIPSSACVVSYELPILFTAIPIIKNEKLSHFVHDFYGKLSLSKFLTQTDQSGQSLVNCTAVFESAYPVFELPPEPNLDGYIFDGWFYDEDCTVPYAGETLYEDTILYAGLTPFEYTICFSDGANITYTIETGAALPTPTRDKYTFLGWYDNAEFDGEPITNVSAGEFGDREYFAKWEYNYVTVTFVVKGQTYTEIEIEKGTVLVSAQEVQDVLAESFIPMSMLNFAVETDLEIELMSVTEGDPDRTVYGNTSSIYTGTAKFYYDIMQYEYLEINGKPFVKGTLLTNINDDERSNDLLFASGGYHIYIKEGSGDIDLSVSNTYTMFNSVSNWIVDTYYMTPDNRSGATFYIDLSTLNLQCGKDYTLFVGRTKYNGNKSFYVTQGGTASVHNFSFQIPLSFVNLPDEPTKDGYSFAGWYYDSNFTTPYNNELVLGAIDLYAKFVIDTYNITLNVIGGEVTTYPSSYSVDTADIILPVPTRVGHTFEGWYDSLSFNGNPVEKIAKGSYGDVTLYARWKILTYTVTFWVNDVVYKTVEVEHGKILADVTEVQQFLAIEGISLLTDIDLDTVVVEDLSIDGKTDSKWVYAFINMAVALEAFGTWIVANWIWILIGCIIAIIAIIFIVKKVRS